MRAPLRSFLAGLSLALAAASVHAADKQQSLRPEVGKPLQEAQKALTSKDYRTALAKIGEAEQIPGLTPFESYTAARMKIAAASGAGDNAGVVQAFDVALASGLMPQEDKLKLLGPVAQTAYNIKNYPKAVEYLKAYQAAGGNDPQILGVLAPALYLSNDFAGAQKELKATVAKAEAAGQTPTKMQLELLASCAIKLNDSAGYLDALKKLVASYPEKKYWLDLIARTAGKPGYANRLDLDLYRLKLATDSMEGAGDYESAADLALRAGFPGEAQQYLDRGKAAGVLTGSPTQKQLMDSTASKLSADKASLAAGEKAAAALASGDGLVATGLNYVGYGQYDKGVALIQQGIAKGGLKKPEDAKLHLGYAQLLAGRTAEAQQTLRSVSGGEGAGDIAQLWLLVKKGA
ncbi:tetratricopeptide repeat protein [Solimonas soli]|uniref:tetratricopeptide repeat protein n=1 Tax=Solimonas soli TaxID=413479 RepID=UPI000686BB11|nr:hypothetical protein [Solimonas soli]